MIEIYSVGKLLSTVRNRLVILLSASLFLAACYSSPLHSPSITGDIAISENSHNNLCFTADLKKATHIEMPYKDLEYIKMDSITLSNINQLNNDEMVLQITPKLEEYYRIYDNKEICIDEFDSKLDQAKYFDILPGEYEVYILGLDQKEKYMVSYYTTFSYPLQ